jgi:hypothetical protein
MPEILSAPFGSKIYPGRLNPRESGDYRAQEIYEAIMTDLVHMGILSQAQFEQYNHRYIQPENKPLKPQLEPFPNLVPKQFDPVVDGGKQLVIDPITGQVTPESETGVFKQIFPGHIGIGYSIDKDGNPPPNPGTADGQFWYMLVWNGQWEIIEWEWFAAQSSWEFESAELDPIENFQYVMIDSDGTGSKGYFILETGDTENDLPTWQPLTPSIPSPLPISAGGTGASTLSGAQTELGIVQPPALPLSIANGGTSASTLADAQTTLGIPSLPLSIANGGTSASTLADAKTALGIPSLPLSVPSGGTGQTSATAYRKQIADNLAFSRPFNDWYDMQTGYTQTSTDRNYSVCIRCCGLVFIRVTFTTTNQIAIAGAGIFCVYKGATNALLGVPMPCSIPGFLTTDGRNLVGLVTVEQTTGNIIFRNNSGAIIPANTPLQVSAFGIGAWNIY